MEEERRIFGIVTKCPSVKKDTWKMTVEIYLEDETREIVIIVDSEKFFLPIENGDRISAAIKDHSPDTSKIYELLSPPLVFLFNDEKNIIDLFSAALRFSGKGMYSLLKEKVYVLWEKKLKDDEDVPFVAEEEIIKYLNVLCVDYALLKGNTQLPFQERDNAHLQKILRAWYSKRVMRQLYLLGLTKREIFSCDENPLELYEKCIVNPFRVPSITIENCKRILGILDKPISQEMLYGGKILRYILEISNNRGWTYCPEFILSSEFPHYKKYEEKLKSDYFLIFDGEEIGKRRIYYSEAYRAEIGVAEYISDLLSKERDVSLSGEVERILTFETNTTEGKMQYTPQQIDAIRNALECPLSVISGGAGCGKTTTIKKIVSILDTLGKNLCITSFTGKAVVRICEVLSERRANTMDYLIVRKKHFDSQDLKMNWMYFDYLIIDEISMVPTSLFYRFISVFTHPFKLILIGDRNQLPPIGCGGFFEQLLALNSIPSVYLTFNHRLISKENNQILTNANKILESGKTGNVPVLDSGVEYEEILSTKEPTPDPFELLKEFKNRGVTVNKFRVLCPFNEPLSYLNTFIQELFISEGREKDFIEKKGKKFYISDQVMMLKNDSLSGLKNGSVGTVVDFNHEYVLVEFDFLDSIQSVKFWFNPGYDDEKLDVKLITLAYATSIHKSQGSEYDIVIVYIPKRKIENGRTGFLNYKMMYTAITRAKKYCWVVGSRQTFYSAMIKIPSKRYEMLSSRISGDEGNDDSGDNGAFDFEENYDGEFI